MDTASRHTIAGLAISSLSSPLRDNGNYTTVFACCTTRLVVRMRDCVWPVTGALTLLEDSQRWRRRGRRYTSSINPAEPSSILAAPFRAPWTFLSAIARSRCLGSLESLSTYCQFFRSSRTRMAGAPWWSKENFKLGDEVCYVSVKSAVKRRLVAYCPCYR